MQRSHAGLIAVAGALEPPPLESVPAETAPSAVVRQRLAAQLDRLDADVAAGQVPDWLREPVRHIGVVLRRLGDGLYACYDVPDLPRTDNALEQFYRRVKSEQRRITGRKRADAFVVRVGGFAVYATAMAASGTPEGTLCAHLARVPAAAWQHHRAQLRVTQARQTKMRRFRLHRAAYLADLEARWPALSQPP